MPIYEYVCQSCGAEVEVLHGLHEPGPAACDVCGGPMRKRLAPPAIVFRGSGWAKKERREAATTPAGTKSNAEVDAPAKDGAGGGEPKGGGDKGGSGGGSGKAGEASGSGKAGEASSTGGQPKDTAAG